MTARRGQRAVEDEGMKSSATAVGWWSRSAVNGTVNGAGLN